MRAVRMELSYAETVICMSEACGSSSWCNTDKGEGKSKALRFEDAETRLFPRPNVFWPTSFSRVKFASLRCLVSNPRRTTVLLLLLSNARLVSVLFCNSCFPRTRPEATFASMPNLSKKSRRCRTQYTGRTQEVCDDGRLHRVLALRRVRADCEFATA